MFRKVCLVVTVVMLLAPMTAKAAPPEQSNFDAKRYADTYTDVDQAFGYDEALLWKHYQQFGIHEGRSVFIKGVGLGLTQVNFDAKRYADTYADLKKAFGYDEAQLWLHYLTYGIYEGRQVHAKQPEPVVVAVEESVQAEEPKCIVGPEPPLPEEPEGIVGPEPPIEPVVGPEPPLPEEEYWIDPVEEQERHIYPSSPGPWSRDDYDPSQEYIAIPSSNDEWGLMYPEFLTPEEVRDKYGITPSDLPDDYLERQEFIYGQ